jgi:hypothetical protein
LGEQRIHLARSEEPLPQDLIEGSPRGRGPAQRVPGAPEIGVDRPFKVLDANAAIR